MQQVDQAQWHATQVRDVPALGRDSLGVWLSDWPWNNQIGKDRWQGGLVMDLCRGSLLAQIWSDSPWLSPPERKELADVHRAAEGQAGVLRQFAIHPRQSVEERALRLLLHGREAGVPGLAQRLLARQPAAVGVELRLGACRPVGLGTSTAGIPIRHN